MPAFVWHRDRIAGLTGSAISSVLAADSARHALQFASSQALIYFLMHGLVAILFVIRSPTTQIDRRATTWAITLPSLFYVFLFDLDDVQSSAVAAVGEAIMLLASSLCVVSLWYLGKGFGVLPALRRPVQHGVYSWIRHPIYASFVLMDIGILLSHLGMTNIIVALVGWTTIAVRIAREEAILSAEDWYLRYKRTVRFRLIPGLF